MTENQNTKQYDLEERTLKFANFEPYAGIVYHSLSWVSSTSTSNGTNLELLAGTQVNLTPNWNLTLEYSNNSVSSNNANTSNGQIVAAVGFGM